MRTHAEYSVADAEMLEPRRALVLDAGEQDERDAFLAILLERADAKVIARLRAREREARARLGRCRGRVVVGGVVLGGRAAAVRDDDAEIGAVGVEWSRKAVEQVCAISVAAPTRRTAPDASVLRVVTALIRLDRQL